MAPWSYLCCTESRKLFFLICSLLLVQKATQTCMLLRVFVLFSSTTKWHLHFTALIFFWTKNKFKPSFYCAFLFLLIQTPIQTIILLPFFVVLDPKPIQTCILLRFFALFDPNQSKPSFYCAFLFLLIQNQSNPLFYCTFLLFDFGKTDGAAQDSRFDPKSQKSKKAQ